MNVTELVQSAGWKKFMAKLYGFGASVVILGAMFKIQHFKGGGFMITAGLMVEAVIFFFSAFEPLHEELDWTLVYPELAGMTDPDELDEYREQAIAGRSVTLDRFDDLFKQADISPEAIANLGAGLNSLGKTATSITDLSVASVATKEYLDKIKSAADNVGSLTSNYNESTSVLAQSVTSLSDSYNKTAEVIAKSGAEVAQQFAKSGSSLANSYTDLSQKLASDYQVITQGNKSFGDQLSNINKNLADLNSAYELQLKGTNQHVKGSDEVFKGLEQMMKNLKDSVEETQKYKEQMSKLSKSLSDLNNIYGNMLAAMNVK